MALKYELEADKLRDFSDWYVKVIINAELLDYYYIKGCYIMRPQAMFMWNEIKKFFTAEIEKLGVEEHYFPMLVNKSSIEAEKSHLENFNPELIWITKYGDKEFETPYALRPSSETIIYPILASWIKSHRNLPFKLNQWCNVIRWEVKSTLPFIRGREFLWQEGHTAFYKKIEAEKEVRDILCIYRKIYTDFLAVPVIIGKKTKLETFGGAEYTLTVEVFIPYTGRGVQGATSHHLGTNFAKIFNIQVSDDISAESNSYVFQNCWGITTRSLGIAVMLHSDNKGFVCPPKIAKEQVAIVLVGVNKDRSDDEILKLKSYASKICNSLTTGGIRAFVDERPHISPGMKFYEIEAKGIPFRVDVGFKELKSSTISLKRRHNHSKDIINFDDHLVSRIYSEIVSMHEQMLSDASKLRDQHTSRVDTFDEMLDKLNCKHQVIIPWCNESFCEEEIGLKTSIRKDDEIILQGAKSLCIPLDQESVQGKKCANCLKPAKVECLFGRSY